MALFAAASCRQLYKWDAGTRIRSGKPPEQNRCDIAGHYMLAQVVDKSSTDGFLK
jgi:hypothetical protein